MPFHSLRPRAFSVVAASVICGLGFAVPAWADTISVTSDSAAYGYDTIHLNDSNFAFPPPYASNSGGVSSVWVYSGADSIGGTDTTSGKAFAAVVFCTDVNNYLVGTPYTFAQGTLSDTVTNTTKIKQIGALISNGSQLLANSQDTVGGHTYSQTEISSALQIAVWTAEYQSGTTGYNPTSSSRGFWVSGPSDQNDVTLAQTFLNDATTGTWSPSGNIVQLLALNPTNNQNLTYYTASGSLAGNPGLPVVEPAALSLLGLGLTGLAAARRRRAAL